MQVDRKHNQLIVCIADPEVGKNSKAKSMGKFAVLAIYDLKTKEELAYYNLTSASTDSRNFAIMRLK